MQAIGRARKIEPRREQKAVYTKKVESMSDIEIKHKLCKDVRGGCKGCPVLGTCRYGQEARRRELV